MHLDSSFLNTFIRYVIQGDVYVITIISVDFTSKSYLYLHINHVIDKQITWVINGMNVYSFSGQHQKQGDENIYLDCKPPSSI